MAADDWQLCVDWLIRCQILPEDHKSARPDGNAFDLAQALRDGSLICHLLNQLCPSSIDLKDFSPRPQMSQFLCIRNINAFLQACKTKFGLRDADLFHPTYLFDVKDFKKVIETLSVLSKTEIAQRKTRGFPPDRQSRSDHSDDAIYGILPAMADDHELEDTGELYTYEEDEEDDIYEDLCGLRIERNRQPMSKRAYCLEEMVETEKKYVETLQMLDKHFIKPLQPYLSPMENRVIFANIQKMLPVHDQLSKDLSRAAKSEQSGSSSIGGVFVKYKKKLYIYGDFCSNLPTAQDMISKVCSETRAKIEECEKRAKGGKFRLQDLLIVPMQRVLKYHLLLSELIKSTDKGKPELKDLEAGLEAMQDLSLYINEVKRDRETLQTIEDIQNSIVDLTMPANTSLKDYGRLQKDGELKVMACTDSKARNSRTAEKRYIFLFDKVVLICRTKGEKYSYKDSIYLYGYKVDEVPLTSDKKSDKWHCSFVVMNASEKKGFTFFAKTEDAKQKWIDALQMALENTQPSAGPNYVMQTFDKPRECDVCGKLLRGAFFQGFICVDTKEAVHKECIEKKVKPPVNPRDQRQAMSLRKGSYEIVGVNQLISKLSVNPVLPPRDSATSGQSTGLKDYQWYVDEIERGEAECMLNPCKSGTFLIRKSKNETRRGKYSLSVKYANAVRHIKIEEDDGKYYLAKGRYFESVPNLVAYYQEISLKDNFPDMETTLKIPVKGGSPGPTILGYATANYDYAATSTIQVSFRQHDRIVIISKNGSDKGWWKGRNLRTDKTGYFPFTYVTDDD